MPVTFPDGTTAELVYRPELALEDALITPGWTASIGGEFGRDFLIRPGTLTDRPGFLTQLVATELVRDDALVCRYKVAVFSNEYLVFQFDGWVVALHSAEDMTPEIRRSWASDLTLDLADDGFPVLGNRGRVLFGVPGGPALMYQKGGPGIIVVLDECASDDSSVVSGELDGYGERCVTGTGVKIRTNHYAGATVDEVLQGVDVRNVVPAS
jgi:hypothetical protein